MEYQKTYKALAKIDASSGELIWGKVKNNLVYPEEAPTPQLLSEQLTMDHLMKISYCEDILRDWSLVTVTIAVEHPA